MNTPDSTEPSEGFLNAPDGRLHYLDWGGAGRQVHLLHATGFCAGTYSPFVKLLSDDLHIIASDLRGHGGSEQFNLKRVYNWHIFADDLKLLIEQAMSPPIVGMGHSVGAVTTYIAAAKYPRLFSAIILMDPSILPRRRLWQFAAMKMIGLGSNRQLARSARRRRKMFQGKNEALKRFTAGRGIFKSWSQEFVEAYLECGLLEKDSETAVLKCDPELEAQIFEAVPLDVWRYAEKIACPVLAIRGERSDVFTADSAERLKRLLSDYELATIPNAGHFVPMGQPEACAAVIREFIQRRLNGVDSDTHR
jgi:pimeloyl-ACP methyl ester carboxylesterase